MATTTTNYGWDIPQSTDLVKDGATAIATLGQDIDTSVYTALAGKKSGLVLLNTTSFSGVASQSFNNVFTTDYIYYRIVLSFNGSGSGDVSFRFREAGVDYSGAQYYISELAVNATPTLSVTKATGQTSLPLIGVGQAAIKNYNVLEIANPKQAEPTSGFYQTPYSLNTVNLRYGQGYFGVNVSDDFDGFTLLPLAAITGTVSVYGYNK